MAKRKYYKIVTDDLRAPGSGKNKRFKYVVRKWHRTRKPIMLCEHGFHAVPRSGLTYWLNCFRYGQIRTDSGKYIYASDRKLRVYECELGGQDDLICYNSKVCSNAIRLTKRRKDLEPKWKKSK
jgi:hypothetical protein